MKTVEGQIEVVGSERRWKDSDGQWPQQTIASRRDGRLLEREAKPGQPRYQAGVVLLGRAAAGVVATPLRVAIDETVILQTLSLHPYGNT